MPSLTTAWSRSSALAYRVINGHRRDYGDTLAATRRIVLFTDPDTLREGSSRDNAATRAVVGALEDEGVTVVLWGNETRSEMELVQSDLNLRHPFISENGGGLFIRHGYFLNRPAIARSIRSYDVIDFGKSYYQVADALHEVARRSECQVFGFSMMSIEDVARECGLSLAQARLAKLREYDEPFRIAASGPATYSGICQGLRRLGYRCFTHERFHHATGVVDKAQSVRTLTSLYRHSGDSHVLTIGLARAASEVALLQAVDLPLVVRSIDGDDFRLTHKVPTARLIDADDARGWCDAILQAVDGRSSRR